MSNNTFIVSQAEAYRITPGFVKAIAIVPTVGLVASCVLLTLQVTRRYALWMIRENHPVELLTFAFLFLGGIFGLGMAWRVAARREPRFLVASYCIFSLGLLWTAMEEISWGQWFFGFSTPAAWKAMNAQGEMNIHNLAVVGGHAELFRLAFGFGGLFGMWLSGIPRFRRIVIPVVLLPTLTAIAFHALVDLYCSILRVDPEFAFLIDRSSEVTELLVGIVGALCIWFNSRKLRDDWSRASV